MSAAHLRAVPDPEPDDQLPGAEDQTGPGPASVAPCPPVDDDRDEAADGSGPADEDEEGDGQAGEPGESDGDQDATDEQEEERRGRMPDLRPYCDPRPLAELGPLAVEIGKTTGPPLLRAIGAVLRVLGRGTGVLLVLLAGYLSGTIGKRGGIGARWAGVGFLAYCAVRLSMRYPDAPAALLAALTCAVVLAGLGHIQAPGRKSSTKASAKPKEKAMAAPAAADGAATARRSLRARVLGRGEPTAEACPTAPEGGGGEGDEEPVEEAGEAAAGASREAVVRALHELVEGGSGVLHTTLARRLQLPHTRAVKAVLDEAEIAYRPGVRSVEGNGPGVHRDDFPPLPPAREAPQGAGVVAGKEPTPTPTTPPTAPGEGLGAHSTEWTAEELERGLRSVPDPDRGPNSSKIEYASDHNQSPRRRKR